MEAKIIKNVFSEEEVEELKSIINDKVNSLPRIDVSSDNPQSVEGHARVTKDGLGRLTIDYLLLPPHIISKVIKLAKENSHYEIFDNSLITVTYAEYSNEYGVPELNPHKDLGNCGLILDYQLDSNIDWPIGINYDSYSICNNEMLTLYPVDQYHWRPLRKFDDGEFVKVLFFEFSVANIQRVEDKEEELKIREYAHNYYGESNEF